MGQEWYYRQNGQKNGPISGAEMKQLAAAGKLQAADMIWKQGMEKWVPASSVTGLFPAAQVPGATKVPPPLPPTKVPPPLPPTKTVSPSDRATEAVKGLCQNAMSKWQRISTSTKVGIVGGTAVVGILLVLLFCILPLAWFFGKENRGSKSVANGPQWGVDPGRRLSKEPRRKGQVEKVTPQKPSEEEKDVPGVLTARYLPHLAGTTRHYDAVMYAGDGSKPVLRSKHSYEDNGIIRKTTVKAGLLVGKDVDDPKAKIKWLRTMNIAAKYPDHYRRNGNFIENGSHLAENEMIFWEPALKVGAKPGDSWDVEIAGTKITFTFTQFTKHKGRSAAIIRQDMSFPNSTMVTFHTYVKDVGMVTQMTSSVSNRGKVPKIVGDIVLVE